MPQHPAGDSALTQALHILLQCDPAGVFHRLVTEVNQEEETVVTSF